MSKIKQELTPVRKKFDIQDNSQTIEHAIEHCGSQAELARQLEEKAQVTCYPQKVNEWRLRGTVPPYWVKHLAAVMGVKPKEIDPELYE